MCDTCGCGNSDNIQILNPGDSKKESGVTTHSHHHGDGVHHHEHSHHHHHEVKEIEVNQDLLGKNDLMAAQNRGYFEVLKISAYNMVSSPGSGKTTLIERTINDNKGDLTFFVIEGDQQTTNDADRIDKTGAPVIQINTGNGCHLDADMVHKALHHLDLEQNAVLIIENVGNLVCPSLFDLGENKRIIIFSVTEGDDKPAKYPTMFHTSDVCIINKIDLLPYVDFDVQKARELALRLNPDMIFFEVSAKTGNGMDKWYEWLRGQEK